MQSDRTERLRKLCLPCYIASLCLQSRLKLIRMHPLTLRHLQRTVNLVYKLHRGRQIALKAIPLRAHIAGLCNSVNISMDSSVLRRNMSQGIHHCWHTSGAPFDRIPAHAPTCQVGVLLPKAEWRIAALRLGPFAFRWRGKPGLPPPIGGIAPPSPRPTGLLVVKEVAQWLSREEQQRRLEHSCFGKTLTTRPPVGLGSTTEMWSNGSALGLQTRVSRLGFQTEEEPIGFQARAPG